MQDIQIEYNQELRPLEGVLSRVKQPGDFFVSGAMEMPMPRVEIEGAGTLSFPVPDAQIAAIARRGQNGRLTAKARTRSSIHPYARYGRSLPARSKSVENPARQISTTSFRK